MGETNLSYLKGVRTRFYNFLEKEIRHGEKLLQMKSEITVPEEYDLLDQNIGQSTLKIRQYMEKLTIQSERVAQSVGDSDSDFLQEIMDTDSDMQDQVMTIVYQLENLQKEIRKYKESLNLADEIKEESIVQKMLEAQLKMQHEFFEKQQERNEEQMKMQQSFFDNQHHLNSKSSNTVKLPKLEMISFNGNRLKWTEFWDSFSSAVHENEKLSQIDKFNYLKGKLVGEARSAISGLTLSNENYSVAIKILRDRFGDQQDIIDLHYKGIMHIIPPKNTTENLRLFFDKIERHLRSLEVMNQDLEQQVFVSMIRSKLPSDVLLQLELQKGVDNTWTITRLRDILRQYIVSREKSDKPKPYSAPFQSPKCPLTKPITNFSSYKEHSGTNHSGGALIVNEKKGSSLKTMKMCRYCNQDHWSDQCVKYKTINERKVKLNRCCFRCLKEGHTSSDCKSNRICVYCSKSNVHHRSLCPNKFRQSTKRESANVSNETTPDSEENGSVQSVNNPEENAMISSGEMVLMQTALTRIANPRNINTCTEVRILLDCGSQRTYITEKLAEKLNLKKERQEEIKLVTFGSKDVKTIHTASTIVDLKLKNGEHVKINANIVPVISGNIQRRQLNISSKDGIKDLIDSVELADTIPKENENASVELLIGNDYYLDIVLPQRIEIHPGLFLLASKFGWLLTGRANENYVERGNETSMLILTHGRTGTKTDIFQNMDSSVPTKPEFEDIWKLEALGIVDNKITPEDTVVMDNFKETLTFENGRYYVTWPWKDDKEMLPVNKELSYGRLKSCVKRLRSRPELLEKYNSVIKEQLKTGIIEPVNDSHSEKIHYIPHHAVFNPQKPTKIRVVYDASSKCKPEYNSLNECLHRGPVILHDLCGLLMRFRLHNVAIIADIEKAFLQIGLQESERDVTRFLWLKSCENPTTDMENIQEFRFCRVPFGVISSPFLLGATVKCHLETYDTKVANQIKNDIYVDNVVTGTKTEIEAIELYFRSKKIFNDASMNLREWISNNDTVNKSIAIQDRAEMKPTSVLGHTWSYQSDTLSVKQPKVHFEAKGLTKRFILKVIASVFDPLGLFSPALLKGKILLQELWKKGLSWDDVIEDKEIKEVWSDIRSDVNTISEFSFTRCISMKSKDHVRYALLCFCDASMKSYATTVYLYQTSEDKVKVDLVFAKSRVAPVKAITVPRLELMGMLIGVRCLKFVREQLNLEIEGTYIWTDSQCVLEWLKTNRALPVFVNNRIKEMKSSEVNKISYVRSKENPADIATRGASPEDLQKNTLWWNGPTWLTDSFKLVNSFSDNLELDSEYTQTRKGDSQNLDKVDLDKEEIASVSMNEKIGEDHIGAPFGIDSTNYSSVNKLIRVTAIVQRFIKKIKKQQYDIGPLTPDELELSEKMWILYIQRRHFSETLFRIHDKKTTTLQRQLGLFIDSEGILRSKGRLENANLTEGARQPILLPKRERFTQLIVEKVHKQHFHCGVSQTLSQVRFKFWIPQGRSVVKSVIRNCRTCRYFEGGPYKMPAFAPLPPSRVQESLPFSRIGLDYFGPLAIKTKEGPKKTWVCLYTCLATRAIHMELLQDMSAEEFLLGFKRFVSQRGTPTQILSDNASQFKAASETLNLIWNNVYKSDDVQSYLSNSKIKWTFIVQLAPWMGGVYERLIGIVKRSLRKSLGHKLLTLVQLQTLLKEIEATVNSRPLVYINDDINSNIALTPNHFLSVNPKLGIPELDTDGGDSVFTALN